MLAIVLMVLAVNLVVGTMVAFLFGAFMQLNRTMVHQALDADARDREAGSPKAVVRQAISA
jgi:hypothetical protein